MKKSAKVGRKPLDGEAMKVIGVRMPVSLMKRLERYVARLGQERPGWEHTVNGAVRALLIEGLARHRVE
jgi:hypothetical protein